jgi:hypothetical protein
VGAATTTTARRLKRATRFATARCILVRRQLVAIDVVALGDLFRDRLSFQPPTLAARLDGFCG